VITPVHPGFAGTPRPDALTDRVYGRAYADAIPGARFELLAGTGHVPQVETPQLPLDAAWPFIARAEAAR
jgi:hypothetical protein